jgi:hypothetical protein
VSEPRPADVHTGHWRDIEVPALGAWTPSERVSVVIDGDPARSGETVAGLREQSYPAELLEVLEPESRQEPAGSIVVLIAAGSMPQAHFVEAHARWHHAVADSVSFGALDPAGDAAEQPEPLELVCDLTRDLTDPMGGHHLAAAEGTLAVRSVLLAEAGGLSEGTLSPATARLDLAHRLHCAGAVFVAEPDARASGTPSGLAALVAAACKAGESLELRLPEAAALLALPPFRESASARRHERAALAVNVLAGDAEPDEVLATLAGVLSGRMGDIEVRVQVADDHPGHDRVVAAVAADPRASLAPSSLEAGSQAPFQATIPAVAHVDPRTVADLHELALGEDAGALHVTVPGMRPQEAMIEVVATAAWNRARRLSAATGEDAAAIVGRLYGERWVSGVEVSTRRHGIEEPQVTEHGPLAKATDLGHERNAHLRFRERAEDMAARAATQAQRTLAERLNAREERKAAERVESRLSD